jgi:hypothetical protein
MSSTPGRKTFARLWESWRMNYKIEIEMTADEMVTLKNASKMMEQDLTHRRKDFGFKSSEMEQRHMILLRECEIRSVRHKFERANR